VIGIGVIGCGYWGPNVIRNFSALPGCKLAMICDADRARVEKVGRSYPAARTATDFAEVVASPDVDAIAICTPVYTHHPLASAALGAGKHVLVEKPLTHSVETAELLVAQAASKGLILQVDHTFVYSAAVQKIRSIIDSGDLGELLYIDSVRVNLGLFQPDINVVWDLAPHDVSVITHLVDQEPEWVSAIGSAHYGNFEDQAYVTIKFDGALLAHIHVNWLAPVKLRSTLIGGSQRMVVYDDLEPSEKIKIYEKGVRPLDDSGGRESALVDYRVGDMLSPHLDKTEPLSEVCRSFLEAIESGKPPPTDGKAGLAVVRVLEAAQQSIRKSGERMPLARAG